MNYANFESTPVSSTEAEPWDPYKDQATRSLAELIVKLITVHIVTAANYAYLCKIQRRGLQGWTGLARLVFFILTPPLAYAEAILNVMQAVVNFIRDEADDADTDASFFLSAAMGVHAVQRKSDDDGAKAGDQEPISLLRLSCAACERRKTPIELAWIGQLVLSIFTLLQGVGTIVVWVQRLISGGCFGFDDRIGTMGIATTFLSVQCLVILLLRSRWSVNRPTANLIHESQKETRFISTSILFCSLIVQDLARRRNWAWNIGHNPTILIFISMRVFLGVSSIPFLMMVIFIIIMREELMTRFETSPAGKILAKYLVPRAVSRVKRLIRGCLATLICADIITRVVEDIIEVVLNPRSEPRYWYDYEFWLQTPLSEAIPVL